MMRSTTSGNEADADDQTDRARKVRPPRPRPVPDEAEAAGSGSGSRGEPSPANSQVVVASSDAPAEDAPSAASGGAAPPSSVSETEETVARRRAVTRRIVRMRPDPALEIIAVELRRPGSWIRRVVPRHDLDGPKIRLGVLWFLLVLASWSFGPIAIVALFASMAALAAWQSAEVWREFGLEAARPVAAIGAAALPLAAHWGSAVVGLTLLVFVAIALLVGGERGAILLVVDADADELDDDEIMAQAEAQGSTVDFPTGWSFSATVAAAGRTLRCGMPVGLAAASAVGIYQINRLSFLFLLAAVSIFDAGDFLCGAGYSSRAIGPTAGMIGVGAVTLGMWVLQPAPFTGVETFIAGAGIAIACVAGQWVASMCLPSPAAKAPALRRLDTWLVAAPAYLLCFHFMGVPT